MSRWDNKPFNNVVGRTLKGIEVSSDGETTLMLDFEDGTQYVTTEGDCCSTSWWADITDAASNYGGTITAVRNLELPAPYENDRRSRQESDVVYGFALDTDKGTVTLVFRNSSNGYYGGWAYDLDEAPNVGWVPILTNDWRA